MCILWQESLERKTLDFSSLCGAFQQIASYQTPSGKGSLKPHLCHWNHCLASPGCVPLSCQLLSLYKKESSQGPILTSRCLPCTSVYRMCKRAATPSSCQRHRIPLFTHSLCKQDFTLPFLWFALCSKSFCCITNQSELWFLGLGSWQWLHTGTGTDRTRFTWGHTLSSLS